MENTLTFRNPTFTSADIAFVRQVIADHPDEGRCALSKRLCAAWNWTQPNGQPKDMICRGLLLTLEREGAIHLPPRKKVPLKNPSSHRSRPEKIDIDSTPVERPLRELLPISIQQVRRSALEKLFNSLIEEHHYLGYTQPVGEHLKYMALYEDRPVACLAFCSAAWHLGPRDDFIGWMPALRHKNRHLLAYNTRFLIMPWGRVPHFASHLLAPCLRHLSSDWETLYHHPVYWVETFVDSGRFKGTCYRAANWIFLGKTTGRGKLDRTRKPNRSIKDIYGYPALKAKIAALSTDSTNSSKPPSSDGPQVSRPKKKKSSRSKGGQKGHKGHKRELLPADKMDNIVDYYPCACANCSAEMDPENCPETSEPARYQTFELPKTRPIATEHRCHELGCEVCGHRTRAELPATVAQSQFRGCWHAFLEGYISRRQLLDATVLPRARMK
jgi:hypothetical protein